MNTFKKLFVTSTILASSVASLSTASAADSLEQAFKNGTTYIDARYRYEFVDQDGFTEDADASTLRTRLGYKSGEYKNFSIALEAENITPVGSDSYNDTTNGRTTYPVVADVEGTEVNQAYLQFSGIKDTILKIGRQRVILDGHRFVGDVGWRQNNQTYDAAVLVNNSIKDTQAVYGYVENVNRIFGNESSAGDFDTNTHLFNISNTSTPLGKITGYGYFLDLDTEAPALSSKTYGISLDGKKALNDDFTFKYYAEYARQSDYGDNADYDADYYHIAPAISWKGLTATVALEVLGSDNGAIGFSTPLATLHKFNGWADKFLATPANGLEDFYIDLTYKFSGIKGDLECFNGTLIKFQYHDFSADEGSADYGSEYGVYIKKPINEHYYLEVKYADYDADTFATDTQKVTFGIGIKY